MPVVSEDQHQEYLFEWAAYVPELKLLHSIPNGGLRNKTVAAKLKKQGVKSGVPDIFLPLARCGYHGLYIELKKMKDSTPKGVLSPNQEIWLESLRNEGYKTAVCYGWKEAKDVIEDYISDT